MTFGDAKWLAEESNLVARVRRGDGAAFALLYQAFRGPLFTRVLLPRLGDSDRAGDVMAETFRTFVERLDQFEDRGNGVWGWLVTIAIHKATDAHREAIHGARALVNYHALLEPLWQQMGPPQPDEAHEQTRLRERVATVLTEINPRYRRAIELRFQEDRSRGECATALNVTEGTFDVILLRALRAFRAHWEDVHKVGDVPAKREANP